MGNTDELFEFMRCAGYSDEEIGTCGFVCEKLCDYLSTMLTGVTSKGVQLNKNRITEGCFAMALKSIQLSNETDTNFRS